MGSLFCGETYKTSPIPRSSRSVSEKVREEKNGPCEASRKIQIKLILSEALI